MRILLLSLFLLSFTTTSQKRVLRSVIGQHEMARKLAYAHLFEENDFFRGELKELVASGSPLALARHITGKLRSSKEPLSPCQIEHIAKLTSHFPNKRLKGYSISSFDELESLDSEQVDLSVAMSFLQKSAHPESDLAALDWMAWTIEERLPKKWGIAEAVDAINTFIFFDLGIRFPPQSLYSENIDTYTFLSAVLGQRQGVCLGVSALYLCLAQRLGLDLEIVTPPGHIFVRAYIDGKERNIETTARGIDIPTEHYLSVSAPELKKRTIKDTAALILINAASSLWHKKDYKTALKRYELARRLMPQDALIHELMGICAFLSGDSGSANLYLQTALKCPLELTICRDSLAADILAARCDKEGVEAIFMPTDNRAKALMQKTKALEAAVAKSPYFRSGFFHLGCTYLQRGYHSGAFDMLKRASQLDHEDPMCDMLLAQLHLERLETESAWQHLIHSETYTGEGAVRDQRELRFELLRQSPIARESGADPDVEYVDEDQPEPKGFWQWLFASK